MRKNYLMKQQTYRSLVGEKLDGGLWEDFGNR